MRSLTRHLALFVLLALGIGCAPRVPPEPPPELLSQEELLTRLQARSDHWRAYQANLNIRAESPKGKFRLRTAVVANLPGQLRLEAFNLWGQTVGVLVLNGSEASLWIPSEKVLYTAERPEYLVAHFLGIPIPLSTFGYSLVAAIPPEHLFASNFKASDPLWLVQGSGASTTWEITSRPPAMKGIRVEEAQGSYAVSYSPPVNLIPETTPVGIGLSSAQWQMEVAVDKIQPSPALEDSLFTLSLPRDIRRVHLGRVQ